MEDGSRRRKGVPAKGRLANEPRARTTMPPTWIARRLNTGSRGCLTLHGERLPGSMGWSDQPFDKLLPGHGLDAGGDGVRSWPGSTHEQCRETGLAKVLVGGERLRNSPLFHYAKAQAVHKRIALICLAADE